MQTASLSVLTALTSNAAPHGAMAAAAPGPGRAFAQVLSQAAAPAAAFASAPAPAPAPAPAAAAATPRPSAAAPRAHDPSAPVSPAGQSDAPAAEADDPLADAGNPPAGATPARPGRAAGSGRPRGSALPHPEHPAIPGRSAAAPTADLAARESRTQPGDPNTEPVTIAACDPHWLPQPPLGMAAAPGADASVLAAESDPTRGAALALDPDAANGAAGAAPAATDPRAASSASAAAEPRFGLDATPRAPAPHSTADLAGPALAARANAAAGEPGSTQRGAAGLEAAAPHAHGLAWAPGVGLDLPAPTLVKLAAPVAAPEFARALAVQISVLAHAGVQQARLELNPAEMGPVSVRIVVEGGQAQVQFSADVQATRDAIESGLAELAGALREAGLTLTGGGVSQHAHDPDPGRREASSGRPGTARLTGDDASDRDAAPAAATPRRVRAGGVDLYA